MTDHATKLSYAMRATNAGSTETFLRHRNHIRRVMVLVVADIAANDWTMTDDAALDAIEAWLRDRMGGNVRLPRADFHAVEVEGA